MENQHRHITGYRELTAEEILVINGIKGGAELAGDLVAGVAATKDVDQRWVAIARTHLQEGFMALTRAVTKPTTF